MMKVLELYSVFVFGVHPTRGNSLNSNNVRLLLLFLLAERDTAPRSFHSKSSVDNMHAGMSNYNYKLIFSVSNQNNIVYIDCLS